VSGVEKHLKILWINWRDIQNPKAGGAEHYIHMVSRELSMMGHEIHWLAPRFDGAPNETVLDGIQIHRVGDERTVYACAWKEYRKRRWRDYAVIECINTIPFLTPLYANEKCSSLIFQLTGEVYRYFAPVGTWHLARVLERFFFWTFYRRQRIIVLSQSIKNELMDIGFDGSRITVAEPGVDSQYFVPGVKSEFPTVLYLNRVVPYKNVDHLIIAFKRIHNLVPESRLIIAGCRGSRYEYSLRRLVKNLKLDQKVAFVPFVTGEVKRTLLQLAWVHVLPSAKEGYGISVLEAASCATPSICYDVPGLRDSVRNGQTGILVPYGNIEALASAILSILSNESLRKELSNKARNHAQKFTWKRTALKIAAVLDRES
jgi:glycosyltransferase involved in cell wall biosynthesis